MNRRTLAGLLALLTLAAQAIAQDAPRACLIRLEGAFGEEIIAAPLEAALKRAQRDSCEYVFLRLTSPGGAVADAEAIGKVLTEYNDAIEIITVYDEAISASVFVMAGSDRVAVLPGGAAGAAVAYTRGEDGEATAVDRKFTAAFASQVASLAESNGHDGDFYRAFIDQLAELWVKETTAGAVVSNSEITGDRVQRVDTSESVLALSRDQAVRFGFAEAIENDEPETLAAFVGVPELTFRPAPQSVYNAQGRRHTQLLRQMEKLEEGIVKDVAKAESMFTELERHVNRAETLNPGRLELQYFSGSGRLTDSSKAAWRRGVQAERGAWEQVQASFHDIAGYEKKIERAILRWSKLASQAAKIRMIASDDVDSVDVINAETRAALAPIWERSEERLAWCARNENREFVHDLEP